MAVEVDLGWNWKCKSPDCEAFLAKWGEWATGYEGKTLAMLPITYDYFSQSLDAKSRNMVRKAKRFYSYRTFDYNDYLDDIFEINTSTPIRQGKPMTPAYLTKPKAIVKPYHLCNGRHRYVFIGGFDSDEKLKSYCAIAIVGQIAIINQVLGHTDSLPDGIMNGMFDYIVNYLRGTTIVHYLNYLDLVSCSTGLARFKLSVGFQPIEVHFV